MPQMMEIRWHARGGQGAVTASKVLADAALEAGRYVQSFPEYGPERTGAPIKAFNRISESPITFYTQVTNPDIVIVLDETLLAMIDVTEGLKDDGIILIDTELPVSDIRNKLVDGSKFRVYTLDATGISRKHLGRRMPNTPTIGALTTLFDIIDHKDIIKSFRANYTAKFSPEVLEGNVKSIEEAVTAISSADEAKGSGGRAPMEKTASGTELYTDLPLAGSIVASKAAPHIYSGNCNDYNTGSWRADKPIFDKEKCINCYRCFIYCPDSAVTFDRETEEITGFDYLHCKGCGICAEVCPDKVKAITMVKESH